MTKTVTFWTYFEDRWQGIRLTLGGEPVALGWSERTDEGWSSAHESYELVEDDEGLVVLCEVYTDGRDCDGRLSTEWHGFCRAENLTATPEDEYGPARPQWAKLRRGQRDYSAEAAGY